MKGFNTKEFLSGLNTNEFIKACHIPLGYKIGYPILRKSGEKVFIVLPYRKYKKTNQKDKSAVMPIEYLITFELHALINIPEKIKNAIDETKLGVTASPAGFEVLRNSEKFSGFPFDKPVGVFPHRSLQKLGKEEYKNRVNDIYKAYDTIINDMLGIEPASGVRKTAFKDLLNALVEPGLTPMYKMIDKGFTDKYFE
ncbi:MAG: hypothetical protein IJ731_06685 [Eubacterium sp.]|nr:hypothetical protein [Eubacterium sp.]